MYQKSQQYDVQFLIYRVRQAEFFVILDGLLPFYPPNNPKNQNFEKMKKFAVDIIIVHMCTKNHNNMVYGSWDIEWDKQNFLSIWTVFCPFTKRSKFWKNKTKPWRYYHFTQEYHKWQSYDVWFLRHWVRQTELFVILDNFLPFYLLNNPKNQNFEKMKKTPGDIIILNECTLNDNHMMYGSWDMKCDRQNFLSFSTIFTTYFVVTAQKIKILKKWKKLLKISSFYICVPKITIRWCMVPKTWCTTDRWTDGRTEKGTYRATDRWMDGQTEKVTHRGGCPT